MDTTTAYEELSDEIKHKVSNRIGHFTYLKYRSQVEGLTEDDLAPLRIGTYHPLITTHPETGNRKDDDGIGAVECRE